MAASTARAGDEPQGDCLLIGRSKNRECITMLSITRVVGFQHSAGHSRSLLRLGEPGIPRPSSWPRKADARGGPVEHRCPATGAAARLWRPTKARAPRSSIEHNTGPSWSVRDLPLAIPGKLFRMSGTKNSNPLSSSGESGTNRAAAVISSAAWATCQRRRRPSGRPTISQRR
jgi:hypothetical protein